MASKHDHAAEDAGEREAESTQIELEDCLPLRLLISDIQCREQSLSSGCGAPKGEDETQAEAPAERLA